MRSSTWFLSESLVNTPIALVSLSRSSSDLRSSVGGGTGRDSAGVGVASAVLAGGAGFAGAFAGAPSLALGGAAGTDAVEAGAGAEATADGGAGAFAGWVSPPHPASSSNVAKLAIKRITL